MQSYKECVNFPGGMNGKKKNNPPANVGDSRDPGSIPGSGRSSRGGEPTPFMHTGMHVYPVT